MHALLLFLHPTCPLPPAPTRHVDISFPLPRTLFIPYIYHFLHHRHAFCNLCSVPHLVFFFFFLLNPDSSFLIPHHPITLPLPKPQLTAPFSSFTVRSMASGDQQFPRQKQDAQPGKEHLMDPTPRAASSDYKPANKLVVRISIRVWFI